jgi:hypothetical protein
MGIVNNQSRISGEIFAYNFSNTSSNLTLNDGYQTITTLSTTFTTDRDGEIKIIFRGFVDKTTSGGNAPIKLRLVNGSNTVLSGSDRYFHVFHTSTAASLIHAEWVFDISPNENITVKPQIRCTNRDETAILRYGGDYPPVVLEIVGI